MRDGVLPRGLGTRVITRGRLSLSLFVDLFPPSQHRSRFHAALRPPDTRAATGSDNLFKIGQQIAQLITSDDCKITDETMFFLRLWLAYLVSHHAKPYNISSRYGFWVTKKLIKTQMIFKIHLRKNDKQTFVILFKSENKAGKLV